MLSKIEPNKCIGRSLGYNENKVTTGKAERIAAVNFLKGHDRLTKEEIMSRFRQRSSFNERLHDYGVHFTLNFGKTENLDDDKMIRVANRYMTGMGFEDQPYVMYRHIDAGHTHLHIVATPVRADGGWITLEPKHFSASYKLCGELEKEFSLEKNALMTLRDRSLFTVDHAQSVRYGEPGLTNAISNVLNTIVDHYRYSNLDEFNAILKEYNVTANPGQEGSRLNKLGGLLYHALDDEGNRVGVPIKASHFLLKPTLKHLEQRFAANQSLRESSRERLHTAIEWALAGRAPDWTGFTKSLEKDGIAVVTARGREGKESIFFIDHVDKCAFAGKSLGAGYDLETMRNRCVQENAITEEQTQKHQLRISL
jgi:hypothetical protein